MAADRRRRPAPPAFGLGLGAAALVLGLTACGACWPNTIDAVALPAGLNDYYLFSPRQAELHTDDGPRPATLEAGLGAPTAGALDLKKDFSGVAFGTRLGFLANRDGSELKMVAEAQPWPVDAMALREGLAAVVSTKANAVRVLRVPSGEEVWQADFKNFVGCLHFAVPLSESRILLAGQDGEDGVVQELDRSTGAWSDRGRKTQRGLNQLHACAAAGDGVILAGMWEQWRPLSMTSGDRSNKLLQRLTVLHYDPARGAFRELVFDDSIQTEIRVMQAVVGEKFVALVVQLPKGLYEVRAFDFHKDRQSAKLLGSQPFRQPVSVAWRGPNELLVLEPGKKPVTIDLSGGL